jgi:hypothetical protein
MAPIKTTAFALLAMATLTGCELLPIESATQDPAALAASCEREIAIVKKAAQTFTIKAGPDTPPPTEALLVQKGLLDRQSDLANVSGGVVVPVSDCVTAMAEAAEAAANAPGATTTTVAPAPPPAPLPTAPLPTLSPTTAP